MDIPEVNKAEIRENYMKYARLFLKHECHYNYNEMVLTAKVIKHVMVVDPHNEKGNEKYEKHGERLPEHY